MPRLITHPYKTLPNGTKILADIYTPSSPPSSSTQHEDAKPTVLFFHAGGLTAFNRKFIYPSLVQAVLRRGWTLVSVDYRLLPQVAPAEMWEDVRDAYSFVAAGLGAVLGGEGNKGKDESRKIIVAGASAGTYLAFLTARRFDQLSPPPTAILSYYGTPSFNAPFFNSNTIIFGDEKMPRETFAALLDDTRVSVGYSAPSRRFDLACLTEDLQRNSAYVKPGADAPDEKREGEEEGDGLPRPDLYDYYLQENTYPQLFSDLEGKLDVGSAGRDWVRFPKCVLLHGNKDVDGPLELSQLFVDEVGGAANARLVEVEGAGHMFDGGFYLDDEGVEMQGVRDAWALVDRAVDGTW